MENFSEGTDGENPIFCFGQTILRNLRLPTLRTPG